METKIKIIFFFFAIEKVICAWVKEEKSQL